MAAEAAVYRISLIKTRAALIQQSLMEEVLDLKAMKAALALICEECEWIEAKVTDDILTPGNEALATMGLSVVD